MTETFTLTVRVGPHPRAKDFAEYLLGEVEYRVMNEKDEDMSGIPVEFGLTEEVDDADQDTPEPAGDRGDLDP